MRVRFARFVAVGWMGFAVQSLAFVVLTSAALVPWLPAAIIAAEFSVVHNFLWHERWTWTARRGGGAGARAGRFLRFNASSALFGIVGNVSVTAALVAAFGVPPIVANAAASAMLGVAAFFVADRWAFRAVPLAMAILLGGAGTAAASPERKTLDAWTRHVAATEARFGQPSADLRCEPRSWGEVVDVDSGTIVDWHGRICIPGTTVDALVDRLLHPDAPGNGQDDVSESRVLARGSDFVRVYLRLVRRTIVMVEYETEHEMRFQSERPGAATGVSVMTSIREVGGGDRGLLWRLNSYWRYRQTSEGVVVDVESLSLSRSVPAMIRPLATPIISHVARESMVRTLDSLRERHHGR